VQALWGCDLQNQLEGISEALRIPGSKSLGPIQSVRCNDRQIVAYKMRFAWRVPRIMYVSPSMAQGAREQLGVTGCAAVTRLSAMHRRDVYGTQLTAHTHSAPGRPPVTLVSFIHMFAALARRVRCSVACTCFAAASILTSFMRAAHPGGVEGPGHAELQQDQDHCGLRAGAQRRRRGSHREAGRRAEGLPENHPGRRQAGAHY